MSIQIMAKNIPKMFIHWIIQSNLSVVYRNESIYLTETIYIPENTLFGMNKCNFFCIQYTCENNRDVPKMYGVAKFYYKNYQAIAQFIVASLIFSWTARRLLHIKFACEFNGKKTTIRCIETPSSLWPKSHNCIPTFRFPY